MLSMDIAYPLLGMKTGFSLDYGGSVIKIIYLTDIGDDQVRLNFISYQHNELEEALELIKDKVGSSLDPGQEVVITGINANPHLKLIEEKLNIRVKYALEHECFGSPLVFLIKNFSMSEIIQPLSPHVKHYARTMSKQWTGVLQGMSEMTGNKLLVPPCLSNIDNVSLDPEPSDKVTFPVLGMLLGSCALPLWINEDGSYNIPNFTTVCGRSLLALGSLIADTQSFAEINILASEGNIQNVNVNFDDLVDGGGENTYNVMRSDLGLYCLAKCVGKKADEISRADRAAGIVDLISNSVGMYMFSWAKVLGAEHVFIFGGLASGSEFIRNEIAKVFARESLSDQMNFHPKPFFLKVGGYVTALGALLANREAKTSVDKADTKM